MADEPQEDRVTRRIAAEIALLRQYDQANEAQRRAFFVSLLDVLRETQLGQGAQVDDGGELVD